jgi:hypothetical protein
MTNNQKGHAMTAATSFSVSDRESTPVSHTFNPNGFSKDNLVAFFKNEGDVSIEDEKFSISWRESSTNRKVRIKLEVPVVVTETINAVDVPKLVRVAICDATFTFSKSSTLQERKNAVGMFANAMAASVTVVNSTLTGTEAIW